eukprot:CAMPEP_0195068622 /NCGR_PEP_ID=MMETSP0448-20130528/13258_1 /TAXON_ID=66468 /ORGANISM="Heterocapsa triquestra, Strain CCMP 448" /LENGTH=463 /DNA_ID=CAMNT_0040100161 /DNA_START=114 /DNA_END=1505 /DNA_ORIENTATION=-
MAIEEKPVSESSEEDLLPCISGPARTFRDRSGAELRMTCPGLRYSLLERAARMLSSLGLPCCGKGKPWRSVEDGSASLALLELPSEAGTFEERYEMSEKLGEGSFGKVYACARRRYAWQAWQGSTDRGDQPLAVKVVPTHGRHCSRESKLGGDERAELVRLFMSLDHQNIVQHRQFVETPDMLYIVMDRCEGPDLLSHVEASGGYVSSDAARSLASQMLGALAAVHAIGMMHRDVKPENFRFKDVSATCLQLLDFGSAKPAPLEPAVHSVTGTLLFAAPEVFDAFYNRVCDVWSAGIVLFLLISGHFPFETSDVNILRCMHKDPVLTGDSLLRGPRWQAASLSLRSFMRELLVVDPAARLCAREALTHRWLVGGEHADNPQDCQSAEEDECEGKGLLRIISRCTSLNDMKRSYFVWNLAECGGEDELPGDVAPLHGAVEEAAERLKVGEDPTVSLQSLQELPQ